MNKIKFSSVFKSIESFEEVDIPSFTVITGENGSGKSHFLGALKEGSLISSYAPIPREQIVLYDWNTIVPKDTGKFDPLKEKTEKNQLFEQLIINQRKQQKANLENFLRQNGIPSYIADDEDTLRDMFYNKERFYNFCGVEDQQRYENFRQHITNTGRSIGSNAYRSRQNDAYGKGFKKILDSKPQEFLLSKGNRIFEDDYFVWGEVDPFQQAFAKLFISYRELMKENYTKLGLKTAGEITDDPLSNEEFVEKYGPRPWDFVNSILEECQLDFRIDAPSLSDEGPYEPYLEKLSKPVRIKFADLSSGERVLMSFALCMYNSTERRQATTFPKILLLDEVDAPLHPKMCRFLLNVIKNILVDRHNVHVILTTHKPTTVALAEEGSLFLMERSTTLSKTGKSKALSKITVGVPTMAISFDGRRQVFVESKYDASVYEKLFQLYKSEIQSERSLHFVPVGATNRRGEDVGTGCAQVKTIVSNLVDAGVRTVYGIIDWDGVNESSSYVKLCANGSRNGIENLILDPVIVVSTVAKLDIKFACRCGFLREGERFTSLSSFDSVKWQAIVNAFSVYLYECEDMEKIEVEYLNGMTLEIPKQCIVTDDHAYEQLILEKFPILKSRNNNPKLLEYIAMEVIPDHKMLAPSDIIATFKTILEAE